MSYYGNPYDGMNEPDDDRPAPHEYLPRCARCGAFLPCLSKKGRWTWATERGRSLPIYSNDHRTGSVVIEGEEYEVADVARTTCRRCGRACAEVFDQGKTDRALFDTPIVHENACEVWKEDAPEDAPERGHAYVSPRDDEENPYEREDLPF